MARPKDTQQYIRFDTPTKDAMVAYTDRIGLSVSGWIRMLVIRELEAQGVKILPASDFDEAA